MRRLTPAKVTVMMFVVVGLLVTAYFVKGMFAQEPPAEPVTIRTVPMAIADLEPGTIVTSSHLGLGRIKSTHMKPEMLISNRVIVGRVVKEKISQATPILAQQLYQPGEHPPLEVAEGMRAVSIGISSGSSMVDGLIKPGQYVDIHFTPNSNYSSQQSNGPFTMTLFKGVRVIAINRNFQSGQTSTGANIVTVELSPAQANIIILAQARGALALTYNPEGKGDGSVAVSNADRAYLDEILGITPEPEPLPPFTTDIYRRSSLNRLQFEDGRVISGSGRSSGINRQRNNSSNNNSAPSRTRNFDSPLPTDLPDPVDSGTSRVPANGSNYSPPTADSQQGNPKT